ncbi:MAG: ankyrin repeat domain-containing protein, partial [Bacillus cereus]|nr:ankyrin repeat domain-containing protein [Bacillus cereus]
PIVQYLISIAQTNIYACTKIELTPKKTLSCSALHLAELNDQTETVKFLKTFIHNHEMLFKAIQANNLEQIKTLNISPALINNINPEGCYALHSAIKLGNLSIIEFLIHSGANVNQPNEDGTTPLHLAIQKGDFPIVKLLIEYNADITYKDKNGVTPMSGLAYNDTLKIIKIWVPKRIEAILREHFTLPSGELTSIVQRWIANQQAMQATHSPVVIDLTTDESSAEYPITSYANFFPAYTSCLKRTPDDSSTLINVNPLNFSPSPQ